MDEVEARIPVFLPGTDRDWEKIQGAMSIHSDGTMTVTVSDPSYAEALVAMAKERLLLQVAFDYRMNDEALEAIYRRYVVPQDSAIEKISEVLQLNGFTPGLVPKVLEDFKQAGITFREKK